MKERISRKEISQKSFEGMYVTESYLKKSGFDLKLLELVKYRVSQINECAYCLDMHHKEAINMGESELRLHSLAAWRECPYYAENERAALDFAESLTNANQVGVTDKIFVELEKHYSKEEIVTLTIAIIQINGWNRLNKVFLTAPGNYVLGQFD